MLAWTVASLALLAALAACGTTSAHRGGGAATHHPHPQGTATAGKAGSPASDRCRDLLPLIRQAAGEARVDPALLVGLVRTESNFRTDARSNMGAIGLTQVLRSTASAKRCGDLADALENLRCGARVLSAFLEHYRGNLILGLSGYNAGHAMPDHARKSSGLPANVEYVEDVLWARAVYLSKGCAF